MPLLYTSQWCVPQATTAKTHLIPELSVLQYGGGSSEATWKFDIDKQWCRYWENLSVSECIRTRAAKTHLEPPVSSAHLFNASGPSSYRVEELVWSISIDGQ